VGSLGGRKKKGFTLLARGGGKKNVLVFWKIGSDGDESGDFYVPAEKKLSRKGSDRFLPQRRGGRRLLLCYLKLRQRGGEKKVRNKGQVTVEWKKKKIYSLTVGEAREKKSGRTCRRILGGNGLLS